MIITKTMDWLRQTDIYSQHANTLVMLPTEGTSNAPERAGKAADCTKNGVGKTRQHWASGGSAPLGEKSAGGASAETL